MRILDVREQTKPIAGAEMRRHLDLFSYEEAGDPLADADPGPMASQADELAE